MLNEVQKLLDIRFIEYCCYPNKLANVIMVKKPNGALSMCVDYTNLNTTCSKDYFLLLKIDQLLGSSSSNRYLNFMDVSTSFDQLLMGTRQGSSNFIIYEGLHYCKAMPFELKNARAIYRRLVNKLFEVQISRYIEVCINDIIVKFKTKISSFYIWRTL